MLLFYYIYLLIYWEYMCCDKKKKSEDTFRRQSVFLAYVVEGLHSGRQTWGQTSPLAEQSYWPWKFILFDVIKSLQK